MIDGSIDERSLRHICAMRGYAAMWFESRNRESRFKNGRLPEDDRAALATTAAVMQATAVSPAGTLAAGAVSGSCRDLRGSSSPND